MYSELERIVKHYFTGSVIHGDYVNNKYMQDCVNEIIKAFAMNLPSEVDMNDKYETNEDGGVSIDTDNDDDIEFMCKFCEDKGRNQTLEEIKKTVHGRS